MKKQKLDRLEKAYSRGYQAGILGCSREHYPTNHQWMPGLNGWEVGEKPWRTELWLHSDFLSKNGQSLPQRGIFSAD